MSFSLKILIVFCLLFEGERLLAQSRNRDDLGKFYERYDVKGSFVLFDRNKQQYTFYNEPQTQQAFIPASTFKICNSIIGLETGVIADENFVIQWDSIERSNANWNKSQDMKTAFKNSTVWYYQSLARQVGGKRMKYWLDKLNYGNADTTGGIDQFWLSGGLRITPQQQIDFLKRLCNNELPVSQRTMDLVKKIMIAEQTSAYTLSGKTGWSQSGTTDIGWYVGFVETMDNVYYFANCVQSDDMENKDFGKARTEIVFEILNALEIRKTAPPVEINHLTGDFYAFTTYHVLDGTPFPANGMYVLTTAGAVMLDTPWDSTQFQPLLDSIYNRHQQKVVFCLSTHSHDDRTAGLAYYHQQGIPTWSTQKTLEMCRANNNPEATNIFMKDTVFTIGNHTFETFYPGWGHTEDNIVVWFGDAKILYGGCFIKSTENHDLGYIAEANLGEWQKSLQKTMLKYPKAKLVIPGHFSWKSKQGLKHTLKLLKKAAH